MSLTSTVILRSPRAGNPNVEPIADFQRLHQILAKIEVDPDVGQIDQGDEGYTRRHIFARLYIALVHLRSDGRIDGELIYDRLNTLDIRICLFDVGLEMARASFV